MRPWRSLLAASLVLVLPSVIIALKAPVLIGCVFMHKANITCTWEPGDSQTTTYTLNVLRTNWTERPWGNKTHTVPEKLWLCPTTNTSCTLESPPQVRPKSPPKVTEQLRVTYNFCVSVTAHSHHDNVTSEPRCQPGINEVLLPSVKLDSITSVAAKPKCLKLSWTPPNLTRFPIFSSQIYDGNLKSQIEFRVHGQPHTRVSNVTVMDYSFMACVFSPDTLYSVRLRHRYQSRTSPWSQWSNERQGKTAEDAPSAAPMFWRKVLHQDEHRLTSLLWKPLPHVLANGRVLSYNVICQEENAKVLQDKGNCSNLDISHTSCVIKLPLGQCSCSISASTSVGTSPRAWIWLNKANEKEGPPLNHLSVTAVNDRSLGLKWSCSTAAASSLSGFVVEWFVVTQEKNTQLYWERVNSSTTTVIISDGVEQFKRYAVSVRALYRKGAGESKTEFVYTRQDVPSAGPQLHMQTTGNTVNLCWSLPVEQQRGFIRNYILFYNTTNQPVKRVVLPGSAENYSLSLSPGLYKFWMQASTEAGEGKNGTPFSENIGPGEMSVILYVLPIGFISVALIVIVCVVQSEIVKGKFCQEIPDPSHSSMANWSPTTMMGMKFTQPDIQYSEVVPLNDRETENYGSDEDKDLQTCSYPSKLTDYKPFKCDIYKYQTGGRTSNMADTNFTSCPVIYPTELSSSSLELQHLSYPNLKHYRQPQEGDSELCRFNAQVTDDPYLPFPSSYDASQLHSFNVSSFLSTPLLESDTFCQTEPQQNTSVPHLPFQGSFLMDLISLSQSSAQCDPYLPA